MIQSDLLSSGSLGNLPDDTAVVLIHALNAFGFAWNRRVTEEGVDLNRNFVDFSRPPHSDPQFDVALANLLTPSPDTRVESDAELVLWAQRHGPAARAIIAGGQFAHPAAPFFGGHAPTWARTVLEAIVDSHVAKATRICVIDYHTGLGSTGTGQLIGTTGESMREVEDARAVWGTEYVPAGDAGSVSYYLHGDLIGAVRRRCASARVLAAAHEFGTVDEMTVLAALRSDHGAWRHVDSGGTYDARAAMLKAFFLTNSDWSASVKAASRKSAQQAIGWLATKGLD